MSSFYDKKHKQMNQNNQSSYNNNRSGYQQGYGNNWNEQIKLSFNEFQMLDFRDFHVKEDEDGQLVKPSDDPIHEAFCMILTKPRSGGSIKQALKDKRGVPLFARLGPNWIGDMQKAKFWESIITCDLTDAQMMKVAKAIKTVYDEIGVKPQSLHQFIDEEQRTLRQERLKRLPKNARAATTRHFDMAKDDEFEDVKNPFVEAFLSEGEGDEVDEYPPAPGPASTPNPRDKKRGRVMTGRTWPPRVNLDQIPPVNASSTATSSAPTSSTSSAPPATVPVVVEAAMDVDASAVQASA